MSHPAVETARPPRATGARKGSGATPASHCVGIVTAALGDAWTVSSGAIVARARRAASCLLEPAPGDSVACLVVAPDEFWIIAVLQREEGVENHLRCAGNTRFEVDGGLSLQARELDLDGSRIGLRADKLDVTTDEAVVVGREFRLVGSALKLVGSLLSTAFDRVSHFSKHHQRTTEGLDRVQANYIEREAKQLLRLSGESTLITGETVVKARGGQVHLG